MWCLYYQEDSPEADRFAFLAPSEEEEILDMEGGLWVYKEAKEEAKRRWLDIKLSSHLAKNPTLVWVEALE